MTYCAQLTLDRVKFMIPLEYVTVYNEFQFISSVDSSGVLLSSSYNSDYTKVPFLLKIRLNYNKKEATIDVSSKCLLDRYPELINSENIKDVLAAIAHLNIIKFTVDYNTIVKEAQVLSCDVTQDRSETSSAHQFELMKLSVVKNNWLSNTYPNGVLFVKRSRNGKNAGHSLTIYDKHAEILSAGNKDFLMAVNDRKKLISHFIGKIRYEVKLNKIKAIKDSLGLKDNTMKSVLESLAQPIDAVNKQLFDNESISQTCGLADMLDDKSAYKGKRALDNLKNRLLCKECNYDMNQIKMVLRQYLSPNTNIKNACTPYRKIVLEHASVENPNYSN